MKFEDLLKVATFIERGKELSGNLAEAAYLYNEVSPDEDYEGREQFLYSLANFEEALYKLQSAMEAIWDKGIQK